MIKNYSFSILCSLSLLLWSCADPIPIAPSDDIDGPRMLKAVTKNGVPTEKYQITNYGILNQVQIDNQTFTIKYLGNSLKEMVAMGTFPEYPSAEIVMVLPNYNSAGQVSNVTNDVYVNGSIRYRKVTTIEYNNEGNPVSFFSVKFNATTNSLGAVDYTPNQQIYTTISYKEDNITSVEQAKHTVNTAGTITETVTTNTKYEGYDWRPNPYKTLSRHFLVIMATYNSEYIYNLSENNASTKKIITQNAGQDVVTYSYAHDKFSYPTTNGYVKYQYQAIP